jgi:O-antigen/teichoic acid export membrane protein
LILPGLFGAGFSEAVGPALVLIPAGVLQGLQWIVCRLWAARGRGVLLMASSGLTLVVMIAFALVLVPAHGAMGASVASLIAAIAGAALAIEGHRRFADGGARLLGFVPTPAEFARIAQLPRDVWRRLRSAKRP